MAVDPQRVQTVFLAAVEAADPRAREAILQRECAADSELRGRVEALLAAHDDPNSFLDRPALGSSDSPQLDATSDSPNSAYAHASNVTTCAAGTPGALVAGRYRLLELIGEGGMGTVWMAEQREPVKRLVALKLIKPGMASQTVLARFDAERQALALMDHPNIAKVLDGGTTAEGHPYFVMELVRGIPLTGYCDEHRLAIPERLNLFVQICQAVQHAHQKGIIHRDIKPSNILVTEHDDRPVPKVIDFGLAKALQDPQALTDHTLFTAFGAMIGTPLYMAPEQTGINALDVDTRSDVYALGVILYELLTGSTPLERQRFKEAALDEVYRMIREEDPPKPSTRLSSSEASPSIAACRHTEPTKLTRLLSGELDWIVLKSLEKDRTRRYETANSLAIDIQRYLANEPVSAGPPSNLYRFQKMVQRNKLTFVAASAVAASLVIGTIVSCYFAVQANQQADDARQSADQAKTAGDRERVEHQNAVRQQQLAEQQRDRASGLLSVSQAERGQKLIEQGDSRGLLQLVEARRTVEHLPEARDARTRMWQGSLDSLSKRTVKTFDAGVKAATVTFSPDGTRLFIGADSNHVAICDFATEKKLHSLTLAEGPVWWARTSPDGNNVVVHCGARIEWWDVRAEPKRKAGWANGTDPVGWSRNMRWLLNAKDRADIQLVDLESGVAHPLGALGTKLHDARRVLVSDDGKWLAASSLDSLRLYSLAPDAPPEGREVRTPDMSSVIVEDLYFAGDGHWLFERSYNEVRRYDATVGTPAGKWPCDMIAAVSPDTKMMLIQSNNELRLLDTASGQITGAAISPKDAQVTSVEFSPDSAVIATGALDGRVMLWDGRTGKARGEFSREPSVVGRLAFDNAGRWLAVTSGDGQVRVRPFVVQNEGARPAFVWPHMRALASECAGRLLVVDGVTLAWRDLDSSKESELFKSPGGISCGATTPDARLVAAISASLHKSGTVRWWRGGDFTKPAAELPCGGCMAAAFSPDGRRLAAVEADSGTVQVWDVAAGIEIAKMPLPEEMETVWVAICWSPDCRWLGTRNGFGTWQLWDLSAGKSVAVSEESFFIGLSPDWRFAIGFKGLVDIRNPNKPTPHVALSAELNIGAFDASGSLVSFGERDNTIRVWETATGTLHAPVMHGTVPYYLDFTPDAKTLVTLGVSGLRFWDVSTGLPIGSERRVPGMVFDFQITPDGRYVVVTIGDSTEVWSLPHARVSLAEMERATWLHTGSRLNTAGDFETIPAAELHALSKE